MDVSCDVRPCVYVFDSVYKPVCVRICVVCVCMHAHECVCVCRRMGNLSDYMLGFSFRFQTSHKALAVSAER